MSEHVTQTISMIQCQVNDLERQLIEKKRMVNGLCGLINQAPIYPDAALSPHAGLGPPRDDEYYGQPLAKALRMILERRQLANLGPATVNDIYDLLIAGGYKFNTDVEEHAKRGLYSALTKNTATFHKLPNGSYGLVSWYPGIKPAKSANGGKTTEVQPSQEEQADESEARSESNGGFGKAVEAAVTETAAARKPK